VQTLSSIKGLSINHARKGNPEGKENMGLVLGLFLNFGEKG
jgi:hypothetical protein